MKVVITQDHWDRAKAECSRPDHDRTTTCVLAQAFHDAGEPEATVGYTLANLVKGSKVLTAHLSDAAIDVRRNFDNMMRQINHRMDPVTFPYEVPQLPVEFETEFVEA